MNSPSHATTVALKRLAIVICLTLLVVFNPGRAGGQFTWVGSPTSPPDGDYGASANWDPDLGVIPGAADLAFFDADATYAITLSSDQALGTASVLSGNVSWLSDSAAVRQFAIAALIVGGANQSLMIGSDTNPVVVTASNRIELGTINTAGQGNMVVSGANSALHGPSAILGSLGTPTNTLRYQNDSQGNISGTIYIGMGAVDGSDGLLEILSGADLSTAGNLNLATGASASTGAIYVAGAGSTLTQTGSATITVGSASGGAGTILVDAGAVFTSGAGLITVNATGTIRRANAGVFNVTGDLMLNGGDFLSPGKNFHRDPVQTLTIQNGGLFDGASLPATNNAIGADAGMFSTAGTVTISGGELRFLGGQGANGDSSLNLPGTTGGGGGSLRVTGGSVALSGTALATFTGGRGGNDSSLPFKSAASGGAGGAAELSAGTLTLSESATLTLDGGMGGSQGGDATARGGTGGLGGVMNASGATIELNSGAVASLNGGAGGVNLTNGRGGQGGNGGKTTIAAGTFTLRGSAVLSLVGGQGGSGVLKGSVGGDGGAGGVLQVAGGALNITGGAILLTGGNGGVGPGVADGAQGAAGTFNVTGGALSFAAGRITGNSGVVPTTPSALLGATMNVSAGTVDTTAGEFAIADNATLNLSGGVMKASKVTLDGGAFNFTGGALQATEFHGNLTNDGGTLSPGVSTGATTINGDYAQNAGALVIELGGASAGQFDVLNVAGAATLGATLDVTLVGGFTPSVGASFDILNWGSVVGTFETIRLPLLSAPQAWDLSQLATQGVLAVKTVVAADFDDDGVVDATDRGIWEEAFSLNLLGDADGDLDSDGDDFLIWQLQFGSAPAIGAVAAVPEPTTWALVPFIAAQLVARLRLRPHSPRGWADKTRRRNVAWRVKSVAHGKATPLPPPRPSPLPHKDLRSRLGCGRRFFFCATP